MVQSKEGQSSAFKEGICCLEAACKTLSMGGFLMALTALQMPVIALSATPQTLMIWWAPIAEDYKLKLLAFGPSEPSNELVLVTVKAP